MSWSTADVVDGNNSLGGLTGANNAVAFYDNWAAGDVIGSDDVGGFSGIDATVTRARNWSAGAVSASGDASGFVAKDFTEPASDAGYAFSYWNEDTSGETSSTGGEGAVLQTLIASNFGDDADSDAWDFGDSDISDNDADFPLLKSHSRPLQAVNLARALTRLVAVGGETAAVAAAGTTVTTNMIRLDTNGRADDNERTRGTSNPSCVFSGGVLRAKTNYNGVTVDLSLLTDATGVSFIAADDCDVEIGGATGEFAATLRLEISAPATPDDRARGLTTEFALRIAPDPAAAARTKFVREIEAGDFNWFSTGGIVGGRNFSRLGRRRRCESLRLDSDFGRHQRGDDRGHFDFGRRGRHGGQAVADLQCVAVASD